MSDCTCIRGDDGQVKVPRCRCPQHGWTDTPTPPPALTDVQVAKFLGDVRYAFLILNTDEHGLGAFSAERRFNRGVAAVIDRAKREERERIVNVVAARTPYSLEWLQSIAKEATNADH